MKRKLQYSILVGVACIGTTTVLLAAEGGTPQVNATRNTVGCSGIGDVKGSVPRILH